ncbi:unnamed protein product [Microthlaspi erraticum]|uniref:Bifunctional inhibitor/plant lipid transfer protein/seed storage helical domain-containing protein n=1 Tax=Microthlaspi erraticum TaxID=1685480 RepID=A0A6D2K3K6_9BRAS|nr:unnamed protein product [Microthlaspi erraticum]
MGICKILALVVSVIVLYSVQATAQGDSTPIAGCLQKLLPCQPYLHSVNPPPPATCCGPMKQLVEKDAQCLCTVFNNPTILKTLNLTKENALDLPKACGVNPDAVSVCSKVTSSSPVAAPGPTTNGGSSVPAISFIGLSFVYALVATIF